MGLNTLLDKLGDMLEPEASKKKNYRKKLKTLLKDLKQKENKLKEKLEATEDERKRNRLEKELEIVHTQRKKGIKVLEDTKPEYSDQTQDELPE
jgi:predicted  nucleic acid-binding Zn-ribbon protein